MKISEEGLSLIKKFEGCELNAYEDAVGIPTIAYGRIKNVKIIKNFTNFTIGGNGDSYRQM